MKTLSTQVVILISVIAICISSIAIAFITTGNCPAKGGPAHMMMHMPPPPGMHGGPDGFQGGGAERQGQRRGQLKNFSKQERRPQ